MNPIQKVLDDTEREFDERFGGIRAADAGKNWLPIYDRQVQFLRESQLSLLAAVREMVPAEKEVVSIVGDAQIGRPEGMAYLAGQIHGEKCGYNQALQDLLTALSPNQQVGGALRALGGEKCANHPNQPKCPECRKHFCRHTAISAPDSKEDWEEEFSGRFAVHRPVWADGIALAVPKIKDFIRSKLVALDSMYTNALLEGVQDAFKDGERQARTAFAQEVVEKLEALKERCELCENEEVHDVGDRNETLDEAIKEIQALIHHDSV